MREKEELHRNAETLPAAGGDIQALARSLGSLCAGLAGARVFLTGGTGFFGKWLLNLFLGLREACGLDVSLTVLSRDPGRFLAANPAFGGRAGLSFIEGDVRTFEAAPAAAFDWVIHGATPASARLDREAPDEMRSIVVDGTRRVLDLTRACGAGRLLYVSSGAVYGPQPPGVSHLPETFDGKPDTAYGKGKKQAEAMCLEASAGRFECVIARPFAFVGPYLPLDAHFAVGNFIRDCLENRPVVIRGDGTPLRSYLYAADLVEWLLTILLRGEAGRAYNVGSDEAISISELAYLVRECVGTHNEIVVCEKRVQGSLPPRYVPSVDRAKSELKLFQRYTLSESIRRTAAWHRDLQGNASPC